MDKNAYDVVVVGGGTAGLSAALILGRSRRRTLVVDAGEPRNAPAAHMHGYLSRDGMSPAEFLEAGRREVASYGVELAEDRVTGAVPDGADGFHVPLAGGRTVHARRLVVTTGLVDELPDIAGVAERWGRDVLHCPYCDGWEVRDRPFGVIASRSRARTKHCSCRTGPTTSRSSCIPFRPCRTRTARRLAAANIVVVTGEVAGLAVEADRLTGVRMADGGSSSGPCSSLRRASLPGTGC